MKIVLLALIPAALVGLPAAAQSSAVSLPSDPGLRAVACAGVLQGVAESMKPGGASNPMADELTAFAARWRTQALALAASAGRPDAEVDPAIAAQAAQVYGGPGQGLAPKSFESAQACQAEAEPLPPG